METIRIAYYDPHLSLPFSLSPQIRIQSVDLIDKALNGLIRLCENFRVDFLLLTHLVCMLVVDAIILIVVISPLGRRCANLKCSYKNERSGRVVRAYLSSTCLVFYCLFLSRRSTPLTLQ